MGSYETTMLKLENMAAANTAKQFDWQERMSNTSHQREVKDLVAAGLNPVLSSGGSGAQSYTTSVDSAVNGIANMASAREGANATRYAAQQTAAATRAAAAANLAAAREAAAASRYSADQHLEGVKYQTNNAKTGSLPGIMENYLKKAGIEGSSAAYKASLKNAQTMSKNPSAFLVNSDGRINASNLNKAGKLRATTEFNKYGIPNTYANRDIFAKAFIAGDNSAIRQWTAMLAKYQHRINSAKIYRSGSGVW